MPAAVAISMLPDAETYALVKTLDFGANANTDNMRYDPRCHEHPRKAATGRRAAGLQDCRSAGVASASSSSSMPT